MWYQTKDTKWKRDSLIVTAIGSGLLAAVIAAGKYFTAF